MTESGSIGVLPADDAPPLPDAVRQRLDRLLAAAYAPTDCEPSTPVRFTALLAEKLPDRAGVCAKSSSRRDPPP